MPVAPGPVYRLAPYGRRVGATLIDGIIIALIFAALVVPALFAFGLDWTAMAEDPDYVPPAGVILSFVAAGAIALLLIPTWMKMTNGSTPGKKACGIRVVRESGAVIGFWWAFLREGVVKGMLFQGIIPFGIVIDYLWPLWDDENRALHDMIVKTRVVYDEAAPGPPTPPSSYGQGYNPVP